MRIADVMTTRVESVSPSTSAEAAWHRMQSARVRHLVVKEGREIVGILTSHDVGGDEGGADLRDGHTVADLMTPHAVTATPRTTLRQAANLLRGHVIGCLPVVEGEQLVGIVTTTDLLDLLGRGAERPVEQAKRWTLKNRGPRQQHVRKPR